MHSRLKNFALLLLLGLVAASCAKDNSADISAYNDNPLFFVKGLLDGDSLTLTAGEDGYELSTTFLLDADSVLLYRGTLAPSDVRPGPALSIMLRTGLRGFIDINAINGFSQIQNGPYALSNNSPNSAIPGGYRILLNSTSLANSYSWTTPTGALAGPNTQFTVSNANEPLAVRLQCDYGTCTSSITHYIDPQSSCDATFSLQWVSDKVFYPVLQNRSSDSITNITWSLDGTALSVSSSGIDLGDYQSHTLRAEIRFSTGCTKVVERQMTAVLGFIPSCNAEFTYEVGALTTSNPNMLNTVELVYYDENGKRYTSKHDQISGSFEIHGKGEFRENSNSQATMRFGFSANALLKAADGSTLELQNLFGHFAVAHPD